MNFSGFGPFKGLGGQWMGDAKYGGFILILSGFGLFSSFNVLPVSVQSLQQQKRLTGQNESNETKDPAATPEHNARADDHNNGNRSILTGKNEGDESKEWIATPEHKA